MRRLLPAALPFLLFACDAVAVRPPMTPGEGGPPWTQVTTAHFVLQTDLDADDAKRESAKLEEMFAALSDVGFASSDKPKVRLSVVHVRSRDEYVKLGPRLSAGYFLPSGAHDFEQRPVAVLGGDWTQATRVVLLHELTHLFVAYYYPQAPRWLNEGLAKYMETMALEGDVAVLGRESTARRFWHGPWRWQPDAFNSAGGTGLIPVSEAPAADALVHMTPEEFYGNRDVDPRSSEGISAARAMAAHYQGAWCLVHLFLTDPSYQPLFERYLQGIRDGAGAEAAWDGTLGRVSRDKLESDYRASLTPKEVLVVRAKYAPPPSETEGVREMGPGEVRLVLARLRPDTKDGEAAAQADIAAIPALWDARASGADLALVDAAWKLERKDYAGAIGALRGELKTHPDDAQLWSALGAVTIAQARSTGAVRAPATLDALAPVTAHLEPIAKSPAQLDVLARISLLRNDPDAGIAYEKRALEADPSCWSCLADLAGVLYEKGLFRDALATATLALGLAPEGTSLPGLARLAATCRDKLARGEAPPAGCIPAEQVQKVIRSHVLSARRACWQDGAGTEPKPARVTVQIRIGPDGAPQDVSTEGEATPLSDCVARDVKTWRFPALGCSQTTTFSLSLGAP
jgi:tetratricopeptide (TPR) repeat protein